MGRKVNDGRGRLGGRAIGTKNKPQPPVGVWVDNLLNKHRTAVENALSDPNDAQRGPILAALLVVSALDRTAEAFKGATTQEPAAV